MTEQVRKQIRARQLRAQVKARQERSRPILNSDLPAGAPASTRALVGSISDPRDKLAAIQRQFPDARPIPGDPGNFVFTDPNTGQEAIYNPRGLDVGDIASVPREVAQAVGGGVGAALGTVAIPVAGPAAPFVGAGLGTAAADAATDLTLNLMGAPESRSVPERLKQTAVAGGAGAVGQLGGAAVGEVARGATKMAFRGGREGRREAVQAVTDLKRFDTSPSLAQATRSPVFDSLETFISKTPGGHGLVRTRAQEATKKVAQGMETRAQRLSGADVEPEVAGDAVIRGVGEFAERFQARGGKLFDELDKHVPAEQPVSISNTQNAAKELTEFIPEIPELNEVLVTPGVARIAKGLPSGDVPYEVLKRLRSAIGKKISRPSLTDDIPTGDLKALYGAITQDMKAAAAQAGPKASRAFERANGYWRSGMDRLGKRLEPMIKGKVPEQVFLSLDTGAKQGPTKIRALRKSLTNDQWRVVAATVMQRMGRALPSAQGAEGGEFSFRTFLTNWNKYSPKSKEALFSGPGMRGMKSDLDAVSRAAERISESSQAFANPSGTAQGLIGQTMFLAGAASGLAGAVTGDVGMMAFPAMLGLVAVSANGAARLMTNRSFVRWLASSTKMKPNALGAHLGRLSAVAATSDQEDREAILEYLDVFNQASEQKEASPQGALQTPAAP